MGDTLRLRNPGLNFFGLTSGMLLLILLLTESFFRIDAVKEHLSAASLGSSHRQLEIQFARLDRIVENEGAVDCIFLGNSMVWLGVNPQVVTQVIEERTGHSMRCFNFGVSAMPASSAGSVASILIDKYQPSLLIYGTFARDYVIPADAEDAFVISNTPWIKYRNGEMSISGWMYDFSNAFRYKEQARNFFYMNFGEVFQDNFGPEAFRAYGLDPKFDVRIDVTLTPDPEDVGNKNATEWLYDNDILSENLDGLRRIIQQSENGVQVVIIELPFYETGFQFFKHGKQDYDSYINQMAQLTSFSGVPFWRIEDQVKIQQAGWWDILHLNLEGANQFSAWLGNRLSEEILQGSFVLPNIPLQ
jgi:hypothetical protein